MVTEYTPDFSLPAFDKERLLYLFKEYAYKKGEFPLSSGKISKHYFNSKSLLLLPEGAFLVAKGIMEKIKGIEVDAIGGAALGAAPMAGALAALSYFEPFFQKVKYFVDRKKAKEHGDYKRIEGPDLKEGAKQLDGGAKEKVEDSGGESPLSRQPAGSDTDEQKL